MKVFLLLPFTELLLFAIENDRAAVPLLNNGNQLCTKTGPTGDTRYARRYYDITVVESVKPVAVVLVAHIRYGRTRLDGVSPDFVSEAATITVSSWGPAKIRKKKNQKTHLFFFFYAIFWWRYPAVILIRARIVYMRGRNRRPKDFVIVILL